MTGRFGIRFLPMMLCALVAGLVAARAQPLPHSPPSAMESSCLTDDEIPAADRSVVEAESRRFVQALFGPDPASAYDSFSSTAKKSVSRETFAAGVGPLIRSMESFSDLHVAHRYRVTVAGGQGYEKVRCRYRLGQPDQVLVSAQAASIQAYVVLEARLRSNDWAAVVWLLREKGAWRVQHFQINIISMAGKSAEDLLDMARAQQQRRHDFNAFVLSAAALELAVRGPNFQLPIQPEIDKERAQLPTPPEFEGKPPFAWHYGDASFKVRRVGPVAVDGKIYLLIAQQIPPWHDDKQADGRNRALIAAFTKTHPGYADAFAGLVVEADEEGGHRGFRTIAQAGASEN